MPRPWTEGKLIRKSRAVLAAATVTAAIVAAPASAAPPAPIDPQNWSFQDNLTWADYKPIPGPGLLASHPTIQPHGQEVARRADPGRLSTTARSRSRSPPAATIFGTPTALAHSIPREQVPQFYADFLNKPQPLNNFQTMNRYWMEDSFGRYGVEVVPFGPYRMPLKSYQYHINSVPEHDRTTARARATRRRIPTPCNANFITAARNAWRADIDAEGNPWQESDFNNKFWTSAGQDESGAWQEFGEMRFTTRTP